MTDEEFECHGDTFSTRWVMLEDKVIIDGDTSIKGVVTGFQFRLTRAPVVEVSYFHNGEAKAVWIEEWRLDPVEESTNG